MVFLEQGHFQQQFMRAFAVRFANGGADSLLPSVGQIAEV